MGFQMVPKPAETSGKLRQVLLDVSLLDVKIALCLTAPN